MPRDQTVQTDIAAIRADIADLVRSMATLQTEVTETSTALKKVAKTTNGHKNGAAHAAGANGGGEHHEHHLAEDIMSGAMKLGGEAASGAAHVASDAAHLGTAWIEDMLRKNPLPAVLTALGVGFVLGVMNRR